MNVKSIDPWDPWPSDIYDKYKSKAGGELPGSAGDTDFYTTYQKGKPVTMKTLRKTLSSEFMKPTDLRLERRHVETGCLSTMHLAPVYLTRRTAWKVGKLRTRAMKSSAGQTRRVLPRRRTSRNQRGPCQATEC